jgi:hypothetical protein
MKRDNEVIIKIKGITRVTIKDDNFTRKFHQFTQGAVVGGWPTLETLGHPHELG